jgi:membrane-associated phospholipid phosphatase
MKTKQFIFTIFLIIISFLAYGQKENSLSKSPYEVNLKKDLPILGLGIGLKLTGEILKRNVSPLSPQQILSLNTGSLNALDRTATSNYSRTARDFSDVFQYSSYGFSFLLLLDKKRRKDYLSIGTMAFEVWSINSGLTNITKSLVKRPRPFLFNPDVSLDDKTLNTGRLSFFSGHTSKVASMSFLTAQLFSDYYPDSKWKPVVWTAAFVLPATTGFLRYKGGKHYPTDIVIGLAAGAVIGLTIPRIHRTKGFNNLNLSILPTNEGIGLVMSW